MSSTAVDELATYGPLTAPRRLPSSGTSSVSYTSGAVSCKQSEVKVISESCKGRLELRSATRGAAYAHDIGQIGIL